MVSKTIMEAVTYSSITVSYCITSTSGIDLLQLTALMWPQTLPQHQPQPMTPPTPPPDLIVL